MRSYTFFWIKYKISLNSLCSFNISINLLLKSVIDEVHDDRILQMNFIEFLEALARIADIVSIED